MKQLAAEIKEHLEQKILPFWMNLKDEKNGGFYGEVDYSLRIEEEADKGGIATARFLWTFSAAYRVTNNEKYLEYANHLYAFLRDKLYDRIHRGIYWLVDFRGKPKDTRKHVYAQSFAIYALSEYYRVSRSREALDLAMEIYHLIEEKGYDNQNQAYMEEFDRSWHPVDNEMLSENGVMAEITMNTHIHVLEAYTNLYKATYDQALKQRLTDLLHVHYQNIYDEKTKFLNVFFDKEWQSLVDMKSFGHDIEASWLMDETMKTINFHDSNYDKMILDIAYNVADYAIQEDGSLINEQINEEYDYTRIWWVQAEAMVGFLNAYQNTDDPKFEQLIIKLWDYIKQNIVDKRKHGEWYWSVEANGKPTERSVGEPWKTSYHNSRFCLEFIERVLG
ncbi:AGE family epimerase/isomerase [Gracilibacillus caseinilyticus]|uniref:Cellobiose 2-epimerase n=1 Tax=Gracilibacillus caseinilyticus TaxID=2932256 RepID=A0ABY4EVM1_9BACI|nr:AGE family epimerase/isomerase [Gracilibacillus caseinilyticus]UOQ48457.1 AGE family epimerase/isomerase [Gracilibacillus caseinilyticus]